MIVVKATGAPAEDVTDAAPVEVAAESTTEAMTDAILTQNLPSDTASERDYHPIAAIFPLMSDAEVADLAKDIGKHGLRSDIVTFQGQIIDGRNRSRACRLAGVVPRYVEWSGEGSLVSWVMSINLHRRHLTDQQRAMVAARAKEAFAVEAEERRLANLTKTKGTVETANRRSRGNGDGEVGKSAAKAAQQLRVSTRAVERAARVLKNGDAALVEAVSQGTVTLDAASVVAGLPHEEQRQLVESGEVTATAAKIRTKRDIERTPSTVPTAVEVAIERPAEIVPDTGTPVTPSAATAPTASGNPSILGEQTGVMRFSCVAANLVTAFEAAAAIKRDDAIRSGRRGFLVRVGPEGGHLYSINATTAAVVPFTVAAVTMPVRLVLPLGALAILRTFGREVIAVERVETDEGWEATIATSERRESMPTPHPHAIPRRQIQAEADGCAPGDPIPAGLLRAALIRARRFLGAEDPRGKPEHRTVELFGANDSHHARRGGTLFVSDGLSGFHFHSERLVGRTMMLHADDMAAALKLASFGEAISIDTNDASHLVSSSGAHLMGRRCVPHERYGYHAQHLDRVLLNVARQPLLVATREAIAQLPPYRDQVDLFFDYAANTVQVSVEHATERWTSRAVPAIGNSVGEDGDLHCRVRGEHLLRLIDGVAAPDVELRFTPTVAARWRSDGFLIRTIEVLWIDDDGRVLGDGSVPQPKPGAHKVWVTRVVPSMLLPIVVPAPSALVTEGAVPESPPGAAHDADESGRAHE